MANKRILFCNIAYMKYYDVDIIEDKPIHGGKYVEETGNALEKYNFHDCLDGIVRGYVETKYKDSYITAQFPKQLHIEKIDNSAKDKQSVDGVTVVFCAFSNIKRKTVIVGWYKNATVYRGRKLFDDRQYNILAKVSDTTLILEDDRNFLVPRASIDRLGYGFGQSNIWYASEPQAGDYVNSVFEYIDNNTTEVFFENEQNYIENGEGKIVHVKKYERNAAAKSACIRHFGSKCVICGFESSNVYGNEFSDVIEVHHIVPIHQIGAEYRVDPIKDLIPVCPNCHAILHKRLHDGTYITVDELKQKIDKK